MHPLFFRVYVLDRRMKEGISPPKWTKRTTQKVYVGHLHHLPMIWDPKTKLVSPQFHVMFDDNLDTVQAPNPNVKHTETMDRLFKTNIYQYNDPFGGDRGGWTKTIGPAAYCVFDWCRALGCRVIKCHWICCFWCEI
jgi:hypothetical protein